MIACNSTGADELCGQALPGFLVLGGAVAMLSACSTTRTVIKPNPQPRTSFDVVLPAGAPHYAYPGHEQVVYPKPEEQVAPVYPRSLVRPGAAPVIVVAQVVVDEEGRVVGVYPSGAGAGPDRALFEAAVQSAAMQWKFTPLRYVHTCFENCPGGPYRVTAKPFSLWYVFHFSIVDGKPIVQTVKR